MRLAVLPYAHTRISRVYALSSSVAGRIQFITIPMGKGAGADLTGRFSGSEGCPVFSCVSGVLGCECVRV